MDTASLLLVILVVIVAVKIFLKYKTRRCKSKVCLVGKTVIITGANTGIGYEAALEFAKRGGRIILACRDETKACQARDKIVEATQNKNVVVGLVDFASLDSVRMFAKSIIENEERLDILVNNAGAALAAPDRVTVDGNAWLIQVNYFGPFLLTLLLIDLLKKSSPSRVINVSSLLAAYAVLNPNELNKFPGKTLNYRNTKLCNVLFTMRLAKLLEQSNISVFSLHPGVVDTEIFRKFSGWGRFALNIFKMYFKTPEEGAQTTIYTSIEQGLEKHSGSHFSECRPVSTYATAKDPELPRIVFEKTVEILKLEEFVQENIMARS